jgi:hypothetical protein
MGAWGVLAFENDTAGDWVWELDDVDDLSLVDRALDDVETISGGYLDSDTACIALAACEVLARLAGQTGYTSPGTAGVDAWVAANPLRPPPALLRRALAAIDRVIDDESELRDVWTESDSADAWRAGLADLRRRVCAALERASV